MTGTWGRTALKTLGLGGPGRRCSDMALGNTLRACAVVTRSRPSLARGAGGEEEVTQGGATDECVRCLDCGDGFAGTGKSQNLSDGTL